MRAAALLLWVACAATLPAPRAARVEVTDRVRQEALHNEINWCARSAVQRSPACMQPALLTACLRRREGRRPRAPQVLRVGSPLTQQALKVGEDTLRCGARCVAPCAPLHAPR